MALMSAQDWVQRCAQDGEFQMAARDWQGGLCLNIGDHQLALQVNDKQVTAGKAAANHRVIEYSGPESVWMEVLAAVPKRHHHDLMANLSAGQGLRVQGDQIVHAQYYPAIMRAVELLRPDAPLEALRPGDVSLPGSFDSPIGRYIHLHLDGYDHRIYYEEAGQGIPLLLQHTAGCHGSQWRHLFEMPQITERFRLIAYDLPCHGKSLPPLERQWWSESYHLRGEFLRSVPVQLVAALGLENPVFMGCSVGGLLALDLAHKHPDLFKAVISVEGALKITGDLDALEPLWHPQISNEYKARLMQGLTSPTSPEPYRKETSFVYASGWPPAFLGDLYYYIEDFDLRTCAHEIDTNRVAVHILSGEYDYSGTSELGQAAHTAIAGSTWTEMQGVGHFPMSENPQAFIAYLQPILDSLH
jgi:pimeloyl-ACP methyl ester carboxylesterase